MVNNCCTLTSGQSLDSLESTNLYSSVSCTELQELLVHGSSSVILWYNKEWTTNVPTERNKLWIILEEYEQFSEFLAGSVSSTTEEAACLEQKSSHHSLGNVLLTLIQLGEAQDMFPDSSR